MEANLAAPAALIGDPVRAAILAALMSGRAEPASTLARMAGASPQSASHHLARLVEGGLLEVHQHGRNRFFRLAGPQVARALESLTLLTAPPPVISPQARAIRDARTCYNHLAGRLGVAVTEALIQRGVLVPANERDFVATEMGRAWLEDFGVNGGLVAWRCLDWTERRPHLAGPLGIALLARMKALGWLTPGTKNRSLTLTHTGHAALKSLLGVDLASESLAA